MKEIVVACVRVALKDPNKLVDEQTKDFWKWRDTILYNEDVLLESLCFDLSVTSPYKPMYEMMQYLNLHHDKKLRNAAWAFLSDADSTQMCLLYNSRTIAAASLYAAAKHVGADIPADPRDGKPWWEVQYVKLADMRRAVGLMVEIYAQSPSKKGESIDYGSLGNSPEIFGTDTPASAAHGEASQSQSQAQQLQQQSQAENPRTGEDVTMGGTEPVLNGTSANASGDNNAAASPTGSEEGELSG